MSYKLAQKVNYMYIVLSETVDHSACKLTTSCNAAPSGDNALIFRWKRGFIEADRFDVLVVMDTGAELKQRDVIDTIHL